MTEKQYQLEKYYDKYKGQVPKLQLRTQWNKAWDSASHLGTMWVIADAMAATWIKAKQK